MINRNKIVITNKDGIVTFSSVVVVFLIITLLVILNAKPTFWSSFNFVIPIIFLLFWISFTVYFLIRTIREKTIIDDISITARFFIESKKFLPILRYRSQYETVLFSEITKFKQGVMYTEGEYSFNSETLVIQSINGRDLHFQSYLYSKRTIKIIIDALNKHKDNIGKRISGFD